MNAAEKKYRPALLPGVVGAAATMVGLFIQDPDGYQVVRYVVSILALIIVVFAIQGRRWVWGLPMVVVAVLWNPVFPLPFAGILWSAGHVIAAAAFLTVALFLRVAEREEASE